MPNATPTPLTTAELQGMQKLIEQGRLNEFYTGLYDKGYSYAGWARGVASSDTLTGLAATDYLTGAALMGVGSEACKNLSAQTIQGIKQDMAQKYLETLIQKATDAGGTLNADVTFKETRDFHEKVFQKNGLSIDNWTLETPMAILGSQFGEGFVEQMWGLLRETGGDGWDGAPASTALLGAMWAAQQAAKQAGDTQTSQRIDDWLANTPGLHSADALRKAFDLLATFRDVVWAPVERTILETLLGWSDGLRNMLPDVLITGLQSKFTQAEATISPLVLDLDGDGVSTLSKTAGVHFDHDGNGFAEQTGWADAADGMLAYDRNGNGTIDSGAELFGNHTRLADGTLAANGFAALAGFDSDQDGDVDSADAGFGGLRVWRDLNSNGITENGELLTLQEAGVQSLSVSYTEANTSGTDGNQHKQVGSYTHSDGSVAGMDDVWFAVDTARTVDQDLVEVSAEIAALPEVAGFGNVHSLRQAMARDAANCVQWRKFA